MAMGSIILVNSNPEGRAALGLSIYLLCKVRLVVERLVLLTGAWPAITHLRAPL